LPRFEQLQQVVAQTTRHGRLIDLKVSVLGKEVYLILEFHTGDAAGQNIVTLSTDAVVATILAECLQQPRHWFLDGDHQTEADEAGENRSSVAVSKCECILTCGG
jgi:hydroxymethylglutaryl-CoA reductase (NADPH)